MKYTLRKVKASVIGQLRLAKKYVSLKRKRVLEFPSTIQLPITYSCNFDCVMCGVCSSRCPAGISHPQVAMLARRLNGKYIAPECGHLSDRVKEVNDGIFDKQIEELMTKAVDNIEEIKDMYNHREIEK